MNVRVRLARLAGAQHEIVQQTPNDLPKHVAMGGVLVSTALVASASAAFAVHTALGMPWFASVPIGLAWGVVILNLDRMLVVSLGRQQGTGANLLVALPRLLLAIVIGAVISMPLVLRIFQAEINSELELMHSENLKQAQDKLGVQYASIADLETRERELQDVVAGRAGGQVSNDPDVKAAQAELDSAEKTYQAAQQAANGELDGTGGSKVPGVGEAYRQKAAAARDAKSVRDTAQGKLHDVTGRVQRRLADGDAANTSAAAEDLGKIRADLDRLRLDKQRAEQAAAEAERGNNGLLARLEAVDRLTENRPSASLAHLALFLLFMCVEVLPVLVKLLMVIGPKSLYERLLTRREEDVDRADQLWSAKQQDITEKRVDVRLQLEQDRARGQIDAGREANAALLAKQKEIANTAIVMWGRVASARADADLKEWAHRNGLPHNQIDATVPAMRPVAGPRRDQQTIPIKIHRQTTPPGKGPQP